MAARRPVDVVFVHGLFSSARAWARLKQLLSTDPELSGFLTLHCFDYDSPLFRLRPDRRIAEIDDIADRLRTYLLAQLRNARSVVLVTHSQGGLVVQRFLARTLSRGQGGELARISRVVMYSCPNSGSDFFLSVRRWALWWSNPQEQQLRPFVRAVTETQEAVLRAVVNAQGRTDTECRIPIAAYGGISDRIVPPIVSTWVFPVNGIVEGDHFSVIRPDSRQASSYLVLRAALLDAADHGTDPGGPPETASVDRQGRVSVSPPFGRRDGRLYGRATLITSVMSPGQRSRVHILAGLGGSGKSWLALEIAQRAVQAGRRVWWVPVPLVTSCMREVAYQLSAPDTQVERAWLAGSATDLVWRCLNASSEPWLLVFDNADDPKSLGPINGVVSDGTGWLREPETSNGMVIVTSRNRNPATWGRWSVVHNVPPLDDEDGASMLLERVGDVGGTYEQARKLSAALGGLPLALRAAADYINSVINTKIWSGGPDIRDFASYRAAVRQRFEAPPGAHSGDLNEPLGLEIVREVLDLSLGLLGQRGLPQAAPLLKLFACLSTAPVPYYVLLHSDMLAESPLFTGLTTVQPPAVLSALADLGLVEPDVLSGVGDPHLRHVLSLHPLVQGILRNDEDVQNRRTDYYGLNVRMLMAATSGFEPDYPESWLVWDVMAPHAIEVARSSLLGAGRLEDRRVIASALEITRLTSRYLIVRGLLGPARDLVRQIITNCGLFGFHEDDLEILALRHEQGRIALEGGDHSAAEAELRRVIAARRRSLGENHADTLASRHKLAKAILEQGRWAEAEPLLRSIVLAENDVRGPEHRDTIVVRHSLARALLALGRAPEAEDMVREILEVCRRLWSPANPETLFAQVTLARSLLEQGKADDAEREIRDALSNAAQPPDTPAVMQLRHTFINVLMMQGRVPEAETELTKLLADRCRVLGATHPETERARNLLAHVRKAL